MIEQLNIYGKTKVQVAIDRLKTFEPPEGYWLAFSGGKDSVVIKALADMAGVKYDAHYSVTSVDPPELVQFIKEHHPDVSRDVPRDKDGKAITMGKLIANRAMPPTRMVRYCCQELKESQAVGRITVTGVRWSESANRKNNQGEITVADKNAKKLLSGEDSKKFYINRQGGVVFRSDNAESKRMVEMCYKTHKTLLNPIIDWTDEDVWEFIHKYNIPYCKLYDEGFKRLGCIGCPIGGRKHQEKEFERWPKYKRRYLKAFAKMLKYRKTRGLETAWESPEEVMEWWMN